VSSVVNNVGVNLNTASASLLRYVSGINSALAKKIIKYREEKGKIKSRAELVDVSGMGPKSFEQCAGFLRIPESAEDLDNTWVHPENYEIARAIRGGITTTGNLNSAEMHELKEKYQVGDTTIKDIVDELKKPGRDPREDCPKPIMQKGVVAFEDLKTGMTITGKIKNVVDFGAFVDVGIKETALVHISELSDNYVKDPMDIIKVGDVLEFKIIDLDVDRKRISLSRKKGDRTFEKREPVKGGEKPKVAAAGGGARKKVLVAQKGNHAAGGEARSAPTSAPHSPRKDDDGTMYNPFADALKKMKDKGRR
jgi:uncharacterized protein